METLRLDVQGNELEGRLRRDPVGFSKEFEDLTKVRDGLLTGGTLSVGARDSRCLGHPISRFRISFEKDLEFHVS